MVLTPNLWDIYADPIHNAHEFSHMIGVNTEGCRYKVYPALGIMNDEATFIEVEKVGLKKQITILESDFIETLANRGTLLIDKGDSILGRGSNYIFKDGVGADNPLNVSKDKVEKIRTKCSSTLGSG